MSKRSLEKVFDKSFACKKKNKTTAINDLKDIEIRDPNFCYHEFGYTIDSAHFGRQISIFSFGEWGEQNVEDVCKLLLRNTEQFKLALNSWGVGVEPLNQLIWALASYNTPLLHLQLYEVNLNVQTMEGLAILLRKTTTLQSLCISSLSLSNEDMEILCKGLRTNTSLERLEIRLEPELQIKNIDPLLEAMENLNGLTYLNIGAVHGKDKIKEPKLLEIHKKVEERSQLLTVHHPLSM
jgi:hypothetical protein